MKFSYIKKVVIFSSLIFVMSLVITQEVVSADAYKSNNNLKINGLESESALTTVLSIEKRINTTETIVGTTIVVEIILHNYRNTDVYNVTLYEKQVINPLINTSFLISPLNFAKIKAQEETIVAYTITSSKAVNFTIDRSIVTYRIFENDDLVFTSFSTPYEVRFVNIDESLTDYSNEYTLVYALIIATYTVTLALRIFFKRNKSSN